MLLVTVTLIPSGDPADIQQVGHMTIHNQGGSAQVADYAATIVEQGRRVSSATVLGHRRAKRDGTLASPWSLVKAVLNEQGAL